MPGPNPTNQDRDPKPSEQSEQPDERKDKRQPLDKAAPDDTIEDEGSPGPTIGGGGHA